MMTGNPHHNIYVVTGKVMGGKTTLVTELVEQFRKEDLNITGFISLGSLKEGKRSDFTLLNLENGDQLPLATIEKKSGWLKFRRFYFNPVTIEHGEVWIRNGLLKGSDLVVIDEVGPMELQGDGWCNSLDLLAKRDDIAQIWIVREQILHEVTRRWNIPEDYVFRIHTTDPNKVKQTMLRSIMETINN